MKITLENFETVVNDLTVKMMMENVKLKTRLETRKWMTKTEYMSYAMDLDIKSLNDIMDFMKLNDLGEFEEGTTPRNMMEQMGETMRLTHLLLKRGKPD